MSKQGSEHGCIARGGTGRPRPSDGPVHRGFATGAAAVELTTSATVGNFGPGFDVFSLALAGLGDHITLAPGPEDVVVVQPGPDDGGSVPGSIPTAWERNVASVTVDALRAVVHARAPELTDRTDAPLSLSIGKGQPGGSGLGSSAASAGGAALAFHRAFPEAGFSRDELVRAAGLGEGAAAGVHHDDVAAVISGGLALVGGTAERPTVRRIAPPPDLVLAVVRPALDIPTAQMRALLPDQVARGVAVAQMARVAALVDACHRRDVAAIGAALEDAIATPARAVRLPHLAACRDAARDAGAFGACLSGSGPAVVAVCDEERVAKACAEAMREALDPFSLEGVAFVAHPELGDPYAISMPEL